MSTLITGGAGYIGTHTLVELSNAEYEFIVYDNLSNSSKGAIKGMVKLDFQVNPIEYLAPIKIKKEFAIMTPLKLWER